MQAAITLSPEGLEGVKMSQVRAKGIWDEVIGQETRPKRYAKISALLLGWNPNDCDTGVAKEVSQVLVSG